MKRFLKNILLFSLIILSLFYLIYYITENGLRKSEYGSFKEWNDIYDGRIHADIIIQGSSRAWVQYNTFIIDSVLDLKSYNLGLDGSPFDIQYLRYKLFVKHNTHPKIIIQNVDWDSFEKSSKVYQKYQFFPYLSDDSVNEYLTNQNLIPKTDIYLSLFRYSGQSKALQIGFLEYFKLQHYKTEKHNGYKGVDAEWSGKNFEQLNKQKKRHWELDVEVENEFKEFLVDCKRKNIRVILVFSPPYFEVRNVYDNYDNLISYYKKIAYDNNLVFLDYSNDSMSLDKKNYYNASHLNKTGSNLFTLKLTNQIKREVLNVR